MHQFAPCAQRCKAISQSGDGSTAISRRIPHESISVQPVGTVAGLLTFSAMNALGALTWTGVAAIWILLCQ